MLNLLGTTESHSCMALRSTQRALACITSVFALVFAAPAYAQLPINDEFAAGGTSADSASYSVTHTASNTGSASLTCGIFRNFGSATFLTLYPSERFPLAPASQIDSDGGANTLGFRLPNESAAVTFHNPLAAQQTITAPAQHLGFTRDLNGDGYPDYLSVVTFSAPNNNDVAAARVVFGGPDTWDAASLATDPNAHDFFAFFELPPLTALQFAPMSPGDLDGDGYNDLAVAFNYNGYRGAIAVVYGGPALETAGSFDLDQLNGTNGFLMQENDEFGLLSFIKLNALGDINGDGAADFGFTRRDFANDTGPYLVVINGRTERTFPALIPVTNILDQPQAEPFPAGIGFWMIATEAFEQIEGTWFQVIDAFAIEIGTEIGDVTGDGIDDLALRCVGCYSVDSTFFGSGQPINTSRWSSYAILHGGQDLGPSGFFDASILSTNQYTRVDQRGYRYNDDPSAGPVGPIGLDFLFNRRPDRGGRLEFITSGDFNGDGVNDLATGPYVLFGGSYFNSTAFIDLFNIGPTFGYAIDTGMDETDNCCSDVIPNCTRGRIQAHGIRLGDTDGNGIDDLPIFVEAVWSSSQFASIPNNVQNMILRSGPATTGDFEVSDLPAGVATRTGDRSFISNSLGTPALGALAPGDVNRDGINDYYAAFGQETYIIYGILSACSDADRVVLAGTLDFFDYADFLAAAQNAHTSADLFPVLSPDGQFTSEDFDAYETLFN